MPEEQKNLRNDKMMLVGIAFVIGYLIFGLIWIAYNVMIDPSYENRVLTQMDAEKAYNCKYHPQYYDYCNETQTGEAESAGTNV